LTDVMLETRGLSKRYEGRLVVDHVDLSVNMGEVHVIIGPSGSGKSTLLRCLALLEVSDEGEIRLDGARIGDVGARSRWLQREHQLALERSNIGMVFQRFNLFPHLTAQENVTIGPITVRKTSRADAYEQAAVLLRRVGVADRAHAYPSELSGGQQQRVAIARALIMEPKVLLFDEPTSALDAELVREVLDVIEELAKAGSTMVVVTHELEFAKRIADRVVMMDAGRIIEEATPASFFSAPANKRTQQFLAHMTT
jgi:polar amino acid transport system ATP-binding protein